MDGPEFLPSKGDIGICCKCTGAFIHDPDLSNKARLPEGDEFQEIEEIVKDNPHLLELMFKIQEECYGEPQAQEIKAHR